MKLYSFLTLLLFAASLTAQNKISIGDPQDLMSNQVDSVLKTKFAKVGLDYTHLVDVNKPCDYYYGSLEREGNQIVLSVWDCNSVSLGEKSLGSHFNNLDASDAASLIFLSATDLINNPKSLETINEPIVEKSEPKQNEDSEGNVMGSGVNQHDSRYFFSPTSYSLKKGDLYYNTVYFVLHDLQYGVTDHFSIGMGTSLAAFPFYVTPKYTFKINDRNAFALGDLLMIGTYGVDFTANLAYGTYTYGTQFNNITLGLGYLSSKENEIFQKKVGEPVLNISGMAQLSPYMYFITENYLVKIDSKLDAMQYYDSLVWVDWSQTWENQTFYRWQEFDNDRVYLMGFTGFRFVSKKTDVRCFTVGLSYFNQWFGKVPEPYSGSEWDVDYPLGRLFIPTVSYTFKFGRQF